MADSVETFCEGDITILGSNLPHFWKDEANGGTEKENRVKAIVVQFHKDFFREQINSYSEFHYINELLKRAVWGISFSKASGEKVGKMLKRLLKMNGLERMLYFIKIMDSMAHIENYHLLASKGSQVGEHKELNSRLDKIMHFININYQRKISQQEIASKIGMTTAAFCRYFREKTGKGFTFFVNEMRIGYACKLLMENRLAISQICFESGFNNLSNFNRIFKRQTGNTPGEYQLQFIRINV